MSMIGSFGVCSKNNYELLVNMLNNDKFAEAENLIKEIYGELQKSEEILENNKCSGEVFIALFHYFKTVLGIDIKSNIQSGVLGEKWRDTTGDYDIAVFYEKEMLLLLEDKIDYDEIMQFVNDFFEMDYGNVGQIACTVLLNNLKKVEADNILIWHLY